MNRCLVCENTNCKYPDIRDSEYGGGCEDYIQDLDDIINKEDFSYDDLLPKEKLLPLNFYREKLDKFLATGVYEINKPDDDDVELDPLDDYLYRHLNGPILKLQVLNDPLREKIFRDVTLLFISNIIDRKRFQFQLAQSEKERMSEAIQWSSSKRRADWQHLVKTVAEKTEGYGFPVRFYEKALDHSTTKEDEEIIVRKMAKDHAQAIKNRLQTEESKLVKINSATYEKNLQDYFKTIPDYLDKNNIGIETFSQAWGMMNGIWNSSEFERLLKVVNLQKTYPDIVRVANMMGRTANDDGQQWMSLAQGASQSLEHAAHSDILGVTVGNDLSSVLPSEVALFTNEDTEDLFFQKMMSGKLQVFRHKSEILKPSRKLEVRPTIRRGPMVVCIDTSGSMKGIPEKIAHSVLMKVTDIAIKQHRECFLIAFSISVKPIDVNLDRHRLLQLFSQSSSGGTSAVQLLDTAFQLLETSPKYMNADILWVTDFQIPLVDEERLTKMQNYRKENTRFFGLQIGMAGHDWDAYFDSIIQLEYDLPRRIRDK
ncbi:MAG: hypothetical protein KBT32_08540 [Bacteroidales bacterium]|nr:hypothetical protein [Candidatus Physcocola equi]